MSRNIFSATKRVTRTGKNILDLSINKALEFIKGVRFTKYKNYFDRVWPTEDPALGV